MSFHASEDGPGKILPGQTTRPFRLLSLPFYLIGQARRLCEAALDR